MPVTEPPVVQDCTKFFDHECVLQNQARKEEIDKFRELKQQRQSALAVLLSSDIMFEPFDLDEVTYNIIGPHCLPKPVAVSILSNHTHH